MTNPILDVGLFRAPSVVRSGVELMLIIRKEQFVINEATSMSFTNEIYVRARKTRLIEREATLGANNPFHI